MKTGVAWYRREQWDRLLEISTDSHELESTFFEWVKQANEGLKDLERAGLSVEKVDVDVEELLKWCHSNNRPVNSEARSKYVVYKMRELDS